MDIKNYKECFENLVNNTIEYLVQNNIETMVLGISGGIDSTVTVAICNEVSKRTSIPIVGYSLMCTTNENEECMAADAVGNCFCSEFHTINIQDIYLKQSIAFKEFNDNAETYPIVEGNIKARTRMQFLYYIAGLRGGIVIDTDNLTEHSLGFWTLHGDDGDLDIIGNLWKHEVYGMAKYLRDNFYNNDNDKLHALNLSIELNPTDGNGVAAGGDLAQIAPGYTYDDVDIMINKLTTRTKEDIEYLKSKYPVQVIRNISNRMIRSEFKRKHRPIIVSHIK